MRASLEEKEKKKELNFETDFTEQGECEVFNGQNGENTKLKISYGHLSILNAYWACWMTSLNAWESALVPRSLVSVEWLTLMRWRGRHCPVWVTQHHSEKLYYFYHQLNFWLQRTAGTPCATALNSAGPGLWAITLWLLKKPWSVWYLICTRYILVDWLSAAWLLYRNTFILPGSSDIEWKE